MKKRTERRGLNRIAFGSALLAAFYCQGSSASTTGTMQFEIPAEDLSSALTAFARRSNMHVTVWPGAVRGQKSAQLVGTYSPGEALSLLLADTGLEYDISQNGDVVVRPKDQNAARRGLQRLKAAEVATLEKGDLPQGLASGQSGDGSSQPTPEILITGSRIREPGLTSPTPVTAVTNADLGKMAPTSLGDALDDLPTFFNNQNAASDTSTNVNSAGGTNLNLRGLGPNRTLTLLNGRRVVPGSKIGTTNIDLFPQAAIKRVEIVTGGASAAYGTDAVAGVVNFILDTDFTGFKGDVQGGITKYGDNENGKVSLTFGTDIGSRMHLIVSGQMYAENGIDGPEDRPWFDYWGTIVNPEYLATGTGPKRIRAREVVSKQWTCGGLIVQPGSALNNLEFNRDGSVTPFVNSALSGTDYQSLAAGTGGGSGCNPGSAGPKAGPRLTNDVNRRNFFSYLDYDLTNSVNLFSQVMIARDKKTSNGASSTLRRPWQITIFRDNAFLPQEVADIMDAEGLTSFTMQRDVRELLTDAKLDVINDTISVTGGFGADVNSDGLFQGWHVDGYYQWGKNQQINRFFGFLRGQTIDLAIDAVRDPATGQIACNAALVNPMYADCVPIDIFGEGHASVAAQRYVTTPTDKANAITHIFDLKEQDAELSASGEIWKGWGAGAITGAFGASYRRQSITSHQVGPSAIYDTPTNSEPGVRGIPSGLAGDPDVQFFGSYADVEGAFNVKEVFAEANIPLVSNKPLIQSITLAPSVRWADYSGSGGIWAYKAGLDWQVVSSLRLRSTYSRDVRAATLAERFDRQKANGRVTDDPVTGQTYIFSQTSGGNPNVHPEKADTLTLGAVYQPAWADGLSITVDWYDISIKGAIGRLSTQDIIDRCFQGAQQLCDLITRDPVSQFVTDLQNVAININKEKASGIDLEINYKINLDGSFMDFFKNQPEDLSLRFLGTWLGERSTTIPGAPKADLVGQIPAGGDIRYPAYPEFQATAMVTYDVGPFSAFVQQRFYNGGKVNLNDIEGVDIDNNHVKAAWYTDLRLSYNLGPWQVYGQIINLFNEAPPLAPMADTQTNTSFYDVRGQRFIVGASFSY